VHGSTPLRMAPGSCGSFLRSFMRRMCLGGAEAMAEEAKVSAEDRAVEVFKIKKLIGSLQRARGCVLYQCARRAALMACWRSPHASLVLFSLDCESCTVFSRPACAALERR
jgi:hypothetical protein